MNKTHRIDIKESDLYQGNGVSSQGKVTLKLKVVQK